MKLKKIVWALVLGIMVNMGLLAQVQQVMDITAIIAAIENGYTMMQSLQAMYTSVKTSYEQLQQQVKSLESFDFNQLDAKDPLGSWRSLNTYADRMMTYEQNIEGIINRKDIKIGNSSFSLGDIFTSPNKTAQDMATSGRDFMLDPFETKLSTEEKAVFHQKYGMSYGNYMRINQLGEVLKKKSAEVVGYSNNLQKNLSEDRQQLGVISENLSDSESLIQQHQINNGIMSIMAQDMKTQAKLLGDIAEQLSASFAQEQMMKEAMQEELNMNDLDFSEGFLKILNGMESSKEYR